MDRQRAISAKNDAEMQADKLQAKMAAMPKVSHWNSHQSGPLAQEEVPSGSSLAND